MNTVPASKKRKVMTLDERVCVIKLSNQGDSARKIAASLGVGKTQVQTVIHNKEEIVKEWCEWKAEIQPSKKNTV